MVFFFFFFLTPIYYYTRYIISGMQHCGYGLRTGAGSISVCDDKGKYMVGSYSLFCLWYDYVLLDGSSQSDLVEYEYLDTLG